MEGLASGIGFWQDDCHISLTLDLVLFTIALHIFYIQYSSINNVIYSAVTKSYLSIYQRDKFPLVYLLLIISFNLCDIFQYNFVFLSKTESEIMELKETTLSAGNRTFD